MARKIAFISALGGQGCTLAAACIAKAADTEGHPVTLVDLCGFGGTLPYILGVGEEVVMHLADVVAGECPPEDALMECGGDLRLLPSGSFSERTVSPCSEEVAGVLDALSQEADVYADCPAGTVPDRRMTECFDLFIICARPDKLSLSYASALCRLIRRASAQAVNPCGIRLLLTRFAPDYIRLGGVADIDECINTVGARLIGVLPEDSTAGEAAMSGQPPDENSELMRYARDTAKRIYGIRVPLDPARSFRLRI